MGSLLSKLSHSPRQILQLLKLGAPVQGLSVQCTLPTELPLSQLTFREKSKACFTPAAECVGEMLS